MREKKSKKKLPALSDQTLLKQIAALERKLELEIIHFNETCSENSDIRDRIEVCRNDIINHKQSLGSIQGDIMSVSTKGEKRSVMFNQGLEDANRYRERLTILRSKSAGEKTRYSQRINSLASIIKDERNTKLKSYKNLEASFDLKPTRATDSVELTNLLRKLVNKWKKCLKERKTVLENYKKNIKLIQQAFQEIKEATGFQISMKSLPPSLNLKSRFMKCENT